MVRKDMQNELIEIQEKMERIIIIITHDLDEVLSLSMVVTASLVGAPGIGGDV